MGTGTAGRQYHPQNLFGIKMHDLFRRQIIRRQNYLIICGSIHWRHAAEDLFHPPGNIRHIRSPAPHIFIIHVAEDRGKLLSRLFHGCFRIQPVPDAGFHTFRIFVVLQHHLMNFKNSRIFFAYGFQGPGMQRLQLSGSLVTRLPEAH